MNTSNAEFDVQYKITVVKTFFIDAPIDADEFSIIERAVELFNADDSYHNIVQSDVALVQYYDSALEDF